MSSRSHRRPLAAAFSLIEIVAAVAIFAIGMLAVLGLYAPVTSSVAKVTEAEVAARVADAIRARLRALPFATARELMQTPSAVRSKDASGAYNPNDGEKYPAVIFARQDGEVGVYDATEGRRRWYDSRGTALRDVDKFFEVDLIRNEDLSPEGLDDVAPILTYTMRVRWPAFVPLSPTTAVQTGQGGAGASVPFDHGRKQVLLFNGAITR